MERTTERQTGLQFTQKHHYRLECLRGDQTKVCRLLSTFSHGSRRLHLSLPICLFDGVHTLLEFFAPCIGGNAAKDDRGRCTAAEEETITNTTTITKSTEGWGAASFEVRTENATAISHKQCHTFYQEKFIANKTFNTPAPSRGGALLGIIHSAIWLVFPFPA